MVGIQEGKKGGFSRLPGPDGGGQEADCFGTRMPGPLGGVAGTAGGHFRAFPSGRSPWNFTGRAGRRWRRRRPAALPARRGGPGGAGGRARAAAGGGAWGGPAPAGGDGRPGGGEAANGRGLAGVGVVVGLPGDRPARSGADGGGRAEVGWERADGRAGGRAGSRAGWGRSRPVGEGVRPIAAVQGHAGAPRRQRPRGLGAGRAFGGLCAGVFSPRGRGG